MNLPVIGISLYREDASWGVWHEPADLLPADYSQCVELAGGVPVLLPPDNDVAAASALLARLDGLIISGGGDVNPDRYAAPTDPHTGGVHDERDSWELRLLDAAAEYDVPVLGICRGMQVLAVWAGGGLIQHLPDTVRHDDHSPGADRFGQVPVSTAVGSRLRALVGETLPSQCHHHQAVADHPGFEVSARAVDGTVEAIEQTGERFVLGVQWHPEKLRDLGLFAGLVQAARQRISAAGR